MSVTLPIWSEQPVAPLPGREDGQQGQHYSEHHSSIESRPPWMFAMTGGFLSLFVALFEDFAQLRVDFVIRHFLDGFFRNGGFEVLPPSPTLREAPFK